MSATQSDTVARLCEQYRGIEGFYVLNRHGEVGYFSPEGDRLIRETFSEWTEAPAEGGEDQGADLLRLFFSRLAAAAKAFPPSPDLEIGYLEPNDGSKLWHTATLVLHQPVMENLRVAFDQAVARGTITLDEGDRLMSDMTPERGLYRGVEDLVNHVGAFGSRPYFPVLYYQPNAPEDAAQATRPLRVLNLVALLGGSGGFAKILDTMRENLAHRGALNQASRLEHRFKLQDEAD